MSYFLAVLKLKTSFTLVNILKKSLPVKFLLLISIQTQISYRLHKLMLESMVNFKLLLTLKIFTLEQLFLSLLMEQR